jgi:hypothetical protein
MAASVAAAWRRRGEKMASENGGISRNNLALPHASRISASLRRTLPHLAPHAP